MSELQQRALSALRFNWAWTPDDVWGASRYHVEGMHAEVEREVLASLRDARASSRGSPIGLALRGQRGSGKTHLLGWVRRQVQREGGYFFLVDLDQSAEFWTSVQLSLRRDLFRTNEEGDTQLTLLLRRLVERIGLPARQAAGILGEDLPSKKDLDALIMALRTVDPQVALECRDTVRALVLYASTDLTLSNIGEQFLNSLGESEQGERADWGIRPGPRSARLIVRDVSWLMAMTGPAVIAVDQLDTFAVRPTHADDGQQLYLSLTQVADGLMALRENTRRTATLVSCIPATWVLLKERTIATAADRFREARHLTRIPTGEVARELVARRLAEPYAEVGFTPPYPTWPVAEQSFVGIDNQYTPRALLQRIDAHVRHCLLTGRVSELPSLDEPQPTEETVVVTHDLAPLDRQFAELKQHADVKPALDPAEEDRVMPKLLAAALTAWMVEHGDSGVEWKLDPPFGGKRPLHARLRRTLDEETEDEAHWSFRAIAHGNAIAAQARLRDARIESALRPDHTRELVVLRNAPWPSGKVTAKKLAEFKESGGRDLPVTDDDLRTFRALETLLREKPAGLEAWLVARKPASRTELLDNVLGKQVEPEPENPSWAEPERPAPIWTPPVEAVPEVDPHLVTLGETMADDSPVQVSLESLRKHTAIFAGTGSGKTVLIRRLVEECALRGVSAIVLDPNNDLARLGDPWPSPPLGWRPGDAQLAAEYLAGTEVVVWTPARQSGRPLSFQPLPDFAAVRDDPDEFGQAVEAAATSLEPRANITGSTNKARWSRAVLREALRYYARRGQRSLEGLIAVLADLPEGVSTLDDAQKLAAELAKSLRAAKVNDTLFGGVGEAVDPGVLLTPSPGRKARISVINFVGLPSDEQRQGFVNQLQLELFSWIKNNPAGDRPLGGLLVMDEAQTIAPSGVMTPSTQSTLMLVAQARKYGLGLVFATQAPKGLHNRIPGNAATLVIGRLHAPAQLAAAREMAQAKGGALDHVGGLKAGQFYAATETSRFHRLRTPNCLSHHPASALTPEEVIRRARSEVWPSEDPDAP
ncbi:helicase HerA domain-containing protein [Actinophytocola gossypii]|uniref:DUF87 domain-containing protein n=1 Tax=Actinophytocola gossypii TaxID=2812003 RepID=A0ABT2JGK8_9PSEU|nr:DUF87 domain-containing protein [Actinophytocola gossypii]MCT2587009.1 DUF87 domain-containing protein [Actinophytocola gossypii]